MSTTADMPQRTTFCSVNLESLRSRIRAVEEKQIFFIGGMAKSGTTWLERLVNAHPEVVCNGEAHFGTLLEPGLRNAVSTYNAKIPKQGNWARHRRENSMQFAAESILFDNDDFDCLLGDALKLMFAKWCGDDTIRCVGDKTPGNLIYYPMFQRLFPQAKYMHMIRDVRDVVVSGWFFNLALDPTRVIESYRGIGPYAITAAKQWYETVSNARAHGRLLHDRYLEVRYEDLWRNPEPEAARLFDFLGVSCDTRAVRDCIRLSDFSVLSKGRTRGTENRRSFYRKGVVGDWENHLDTETITEIRQLCGGLLEDLGYA